MRKSDFLSLRPMLLREINKPFDSKDYIYEIKFDGFRALIYIDKNNIVIKSRNGTILNNTFPELLKIKKLIKTPCILDGEIVDLNDGKPNIRPLQERLRTKNKVKLEYLIKNRPAVFVCFDILYNGKDLTKLSLIERKNILKKLPENDVFQKTKFFYEKGKALFELIKKENLEGIVAKRIDSKYTFGKRESVWLKIKNIHSDYFYIGGYKQNKNNTLSLYLGEKSKNKFIFVGKISINAQNEILKRILKAKIIKESPFINYSDSKCTYILPKTEILIYYTEKTKNNMLRHPKI